MAGLPPRVHDTPRAIRSRVIAVGQDEAGNLTAGSSNGFDMGMQTAADSLGIRTVPSIDGQHAEEDHGPGKFGLCEVTLLLSVLEVSVEGEDALVFAAVVAAGGGDVGVSFPAECAGDEIADAGVRVRLAAGAGLLGVFPECDVADVMLLVFDCPVISCVGGEVPWPGEVCGEAGDGVGDLLAFPGAAGRPGVAADAQDLGGVRPVDPVGGGGADGALLPAAVTFALVGPGGVCEFGVGAGELGGDGVQEGRLVRLDEQSR
jgi:hypothetical protein